MSRSHVLSGLVIAVVAWCLSAAVAAEETGAWRTWGPWGGGGSALAVDPHEPGGVYAAAYGEMGVSRSTDRGERWSEASCGLAGMHAVELLADPAAAGRLYALAEDTGPFVTEDTGTTWRSIADGLPEGVRTALALDPAAPGRLYAALLDGGVWRSEDGGESWSEASGGLGGESVLALTAPGSPADAVFAGTYSGVFRSDDRGDAWVLFDQGMEGWSASVVAVDPGDPDRVLAGAFLADGPDLEVRVFSSVDGGEIWSAPADTLDGWGVEDIEIDPSVPSRVWAGTSFGPLYRSDDGGSTWRAVEVGVEPGARQVALDPHDPSVLFVGASDGVRRSDDGGATWRPAVEGLNNRTVQALAMEPASGALLAGAGGGAVLADPGVPGGWTELAPLGTGFNVWEVALAGGPGTTVLFAGSAGGGLYRSRGGTTWELLDAGLDPGLTVTGLVVAPGGVDLWVADLRDGVFTSSDGGDTWTATGLGPVGVEDLVAGDGATRLYAATGSGVWRSDDGGATWSLGADGLPEEGAFSLAVSPDEPDRLVAGADGGVYASVDGGVTWSRLGGAVGERPVRALAVAAGRIFAGTDDAGVLAFDGALWRALPGLDRDVDALLARPSPHGLILHAGTSSRGVYTLQLD